MGEVRWTKSVGSAEITKLSVGPMDNNVYVVKVGEHTAVVDAGSSEADFVLGQASDGKISAIFQTHNHGDHVVTLKEVVKRSGAEVFAHPDDGLPVPAKPIGDGTEFPAMDGVEITVLHTPGHTPGSVCFVLRSAGETHVFAGDTLFPGGPGNTFGNAQAFETIMRSLDGKLFVLPDDAHIYPGHGGDTTIGEERPSLEEWRSRGW